MKLYNKYILKNLLVPLLLTGTTIAAVIWLTQVVGYIEYITEKGAEFSTFLYISLLLFPELLTYIVPIAAFVATTIVYSKLSLNNELSILSSTGISKISLIKPAIIIGLSSAIFCYCISFYFMPKANRELRFLKTQVKNSYASMLLNDGVFSTLKKLTIYIDRKDKNGNIFGILLYDNTNSLKPISLAAKQGRIINKNNQLLFYLKDGSIQQYDKRWGIKETGTSILYFDEYTINLSAYNVEEDEAVLKPRERYITELFNSKTADNKYDIDDLKAEGHYRITFPLSSLILSIIAASCILFQSLDRKGNLKSIQIAIFSAVTFITITFYFYEIIKGSIWSTYLLYIFTIIVPIAYLTTIKDGKKINLSKKT